MINAHMNMRTANSTGPVGLVCRSIDSGELFVKVGTEALPKRSEIVAVVVDNVLTMTRPDLDPSLVPFRTKEVAAQAISAGRSFKGSEYRTTTRQMDLLRRDLPLIRDAVERHSIADTLASTVNYMLLDSSSVLDEEWCSESLRAAKEHGRNGSDVIQAAEAAHRARFGS